MRKADSSGKLSCLNPPRPSLSLHNHLPHSKRKVQPTYLKIQQLTVCIVFKRKKIQFSVGSNLDLQLLKQELYRHLSSFLRDQMHMDEKKAEKMMERVLGFQSVDGDVNFDYRLSIGKGTITKSKFFYVFVQKDSKIQYKLYQCLAIGGFSKVYLSRSYENGHFYALKCIKKSNDDAFLESEKLQSLQNEIDIAKHLNHPFLVKLIHAFQTTNFYCLAFQYCPGGQLFFLLKRLKVMKEESARFYFLQILYGIQYLHGKSIIYRDLKPENILIDSCGNTKIVDFGLTKQLRTKQKTYSYCGSAEYMAPQMILRSGHSFAVDYYSLGALLYELVTGLPPYYSRDRALLEQSILKKEIYFPQHIPLSKQLKDLLRKLLIKDEKHRLGTYIGIKQILFHPWIGRINSSSILSKEIQCPYQPDLQIQNFDPSQLGPDQLQFTSLLSLDLLNQKDEPTKLFYKNYQILQNQKQYLKVVIHQQKFPHSHLSRKSKENLLLQQQKQLHNFPIKRFSGQKLRHIVYNRALDNKYINSRERNTLIVKNCGNQSKVSHPFRNVLVSNRLRLWQGLMDNKNIQGMANKRGLKRIKLNLNNRRSIQLINMLHA